MSSIVIAGDTSGSVTLQAPAVAGATILTLPATSGTVQTSGAGFTTNGVAYASSSSALATGSAFQFNGTNELVLNNSGGDAQMYFGGSSGTTRMYLARSGSDSLLWNVSAGAMRFGTNDTERLRITSAGNVGIGTSSPSSKLDVNGQINTTNIIAGIRNNITSTDRISVTSATTIFSIATSGSSVGASSAFLLVNGYDTGTTTNSFTDLVLFIGGQTPVVVSTVNRGSPAARTYTASGGSALALAMASGTYNVANSNIEQAC